MTIRLTSNAIRANDNGQGVSASTFVEVHLHFAYIFRAYCVHAYLFAELHKLFGSSSHDLCDSENSHVHPSKPTMSRINYILILHSGAGRNPMVV